MRRSVLRSIVLIGVVGLSTPSMAGGHGFVMRGGGGMRMGHPMPPVAGTWHVRGGQSFITGARRGGYAFGTGALGWRGGFRYGHVNTALGGYGASRGGFYGHTATGPGVFLNTRSAHRYAGQRYGFAGGRYGYRFGGYPRIIGGYGVGYGGYGGDYGSGATGAVPAPYPVGGYGGPPLAAQYSEPPLDAGGYGGFAGNEGSIAGVGGPQIIVVNSNGGSGCNCHGRRTLPVVYRYGVGTYY